MPKPKPKPNHCLAIPITDEKMLDYITTIQDEIRQVYPDLALSLIPRNKLHITLHVMNLLDNSEIQSVKKCMEQAADDLSAKEGFSLESVDLCNLTRYVVAFKLQPVHLPCHLSKLHQLLKNSISKEKITCFDYHIEPYIPHITILNIHQISHCNLIHRTLNRQVPDYFNPTIKHITFDADAMDLFSIKSGERHFPHYKVLHTTYLDCVPPPDPK